MIKPVEQTNTQTLAFEAGNDNKVPEGNGGGSGGQNGGNLSDGVLDSIQQNYTPNSGLLMNTQLWEDSLNGDRMRPYLDVSIQPYANLIRLPVVSYDYNIFADSAVFYEGITVKGDIQIDGSLNDISYNRVVETITGNKTISTDDMSKILNVEPEGASVSIILPSTGIDDGFFFEVVNCLEGKFTTLAPDQGVLKAKGTGLSQQYSACHVYRHNSSWFAIGDLTA